MVVPRSRCFRRNSARKYPGTRMHVLQLHSTVSTVSSTVSHDPSFNWFNSSELALRHQLATMYRKEWGKIRLVHRWQKSGRGRSLNRVKTKYDRTVRLRMRIHASTKKANRVAEPHYRPAGPLLGGAYSVSKTYRIDVCTFRGWILCAKERFRE